MALLKIVAIRDRAIDAFMRPLFVQTTGQAARMFIDEINRNATDNPMYQHPEDYDLYLLGEYDDSKGKFNNNADGPKMLQVGKEIAQR